MKDRLLITAIARDLRQSWKDLILTDAAYKLIAFVVLAPVIGILFRVLLATSGNTILTDQDILFFFVGPIGWICFLGLGTLYVGIIALEQAALLGTLGAATQQKRMSVLSALRFTAAKRRPVILVAARMVAYLLAAVMLFLGLAWLVYRQLLTEFDINYYLKERPAEFQIACAVGVVLVVALASVLMWLATSWYLSLALVLFEDAKPSNALRLSRERVAGHRSKVLLWLGGWLLATLVVSALTTTLILSVGRVVVPYTTGSPWLLIAAVGVTLVLWAGASVAVNLLSTVVFAAMLFRHYCQFGGRENFDLSQLNLVDAAPDGFGQRFMRKKIVGFASASVILALAIGVFSIRSVGLKDSAVIMAHRGSSSVAPENTLAAVKQAIEDGADWVEIDVQETADGEVVVTHDSDFMKQAGVDLKIWSATKADLAEIDIGSWFDPKFKNERVPTLKDVLSACKGRIGVNIELKYYGHDEQLEQRVVEIVESLDMASHVVVMSLKPEAVKKIKSLRPAWKAGLLMSVSAGSLKNIEADFVAVNASFVDRKFVKSVHESGKEVYVWTVNDAPTMSAMLSRGVNGVITDKPALARSVLDIRAKLSSPERVLLELAAMFGVTPELREL